MNFDDFFVGLSALTVPMGNEAVADSLNHSLGFKALQLLNRARTGGLPTVMGSPPTVTLSASQAATTISGGVLVRTDDAALTFTCAYPRSVAPSGGTPWNGWVNGYPLYYPGGVRRAAGAYLGGTMRISFGYGGRYLDWHLMGMATSGKAFRLWVDGQVTEADPSALLTGDATYRRLIVDLGSAKPRLLEIEIDQNIRFGGLTIEPNYNVWKAAPSSPRVVVIGDSYTEGLGATYNVSGYSRQLGQRLGIADIWAQGEGSLGFLSTGTQSGLTARQKLDTDVTAYAPDWIVVALGIADTGQTPSAVQAEAELFFAKLLADNPEAPVTVIGPWRAPGTNPPSTIFDAVRLAAAAQTDAVASKRLFYVDTLAENWQQIAGRIGATSGTGNSNVYIGTDNIHPAQAGHDYLGRRVFDAVTTHARALVAA